MAIRLPNKCGRRFRVWNNIRFVTSSGHLGYWTGFQIGRILPRIILVHFGTIFMTTIGPLKYFPIPSKFGRERVDLLFLVDPSYFDDRTLRTSVLEVRRQCHACE